MSDGEDTFGEEIESAKREVPRDLQWDSKQQNDYLRGFKYKLSSDSTEIDKSEIALIPLARKLSKFPKLSKEEVQHFGNGHTMTTSETYDDEKEMKIIREDEMRKIINRGKAELIKWFELAEANSFLDPTSDGPQAPGSPGLPVLQCRKGKSGNRSK